MPLYKSSPEEYKGFEAYFKANSKDGVMSPDLLKAALQKAGSEVTSFELQSMIDAISVSSKGIDWQCFIDYVLNYQALIDIESEYEEAFRIYDRSGNGTLSRDDIKDFMGKLGVKIDIDSLMDDVDTNKDGVIQYDEFVAMMKKASV